MSRGAYEGNPAARSHVVDRPAYAELVREHYRCVYALCLGMVFNHEDARDLAQETMLVGFQKIRHLEAGERFRPWILQIARNLCIDAIRRDRATRQRLVRLTQRGREDRPEHTDVAWAVEQLPRELRVPIVMFYFDGKRAEAIADGLNISRSNVYKRLQDARTRLYELLREDH